jgi:hypothetical protein
MFSVRYVRRSVGRSVGRSVLAKSLLIYTYDPSVVRLELRDSRRRLSWARGLIHRLLEMLSLVVLSPPPLLPWRPFLVGVERSSRVSSSWWLLLMSLCLCLWW